MTSSLWHAHGNAYLVADGDYEMAGDGALEVERVEGDDIWITIRNPDGSVAEMSGNGTRIAGAWLMERTGSDVARVHVADRLVEVRRSGDLY
jgi:diaminopimelate epimerase